MRRNLPLLLLTVRTQIRSSFMPTFRRHRVTEQQWRVIRMLNEQREMGMGKLADACLILRPSIVGIIARMEELGLVRRRADGRDKRRAQISLTPKGQALVDKIVPILSEIYQQLEVTLGKSTLDQLYLILDDVSARLSAHEAGKKTRKTARPRGKVAADAHRMDQA